MLHYFVVSHWSLPIAILILCLGLIGVVLIQLDKLQYHPRIMVTIALIFVLFGSFGAAASIQSSLIMPVVHFK